MPAYLYVLDRESQHPAQNQDLRVPRAMKISTKITYALSLSSLLLFSACGGGGGSAPAAGIQHGTSTGTPLPGSTVGNWELSGIAVVKDTGVPHPMRAGMNLRIGKAGVEVLLDEYIGPGSMLPNVLNNFYGEYKITEVNDPVKGFELNLIFDFSDLLHAPLRSFYHTIYAKGTLVGDKMQVEYLLREFLLLNKVVQEVGRDELNLTFVKGKKVELTPGTWQVDKALVVVDTDPKSPFLFPAPIPDRVIVGDKLVVGTNEITSLFGGVVSKSGFAAAQPDFDLKFHDAVVGNAIAQGFLAIEGKIAGKYDNQGAVMEYNFFHTGNNLVGDIKGAWAADLGKSPTRFYQVYLTLTPGKPMPSSLAGGSDGTQLVDLASFAAPGDVFGLTDPQVLSDRAASYGADLSTRR